MELSLSFKDAWGTTLHQINQFYEPEKTQFTVNGYFIIFTKDDNITYKMFPPKGSKRLCPTRKQQERG